MRRKIRKKKLVNQKQQPLKSLKNNSNKIITKFKVEKVK